VGGACSTHGLCEKIHIKFWSENLKGRDHLEDIGKEEKIILKWILGN
jgi:hypothetical protein